MSRFSSTVLCCAAVALVLASVSATTPMTWSSCSSSAATCKTLNVTMTPDPAVRGKTVTFSVTCDGTGPPVTGGTSKNVVYLFGIKVLSVTKELCSLTTCPIQPGVHTVTGGMVVPAITPANEPLKMVMTNTDQNGNELNCVDVMYEVVA